MSEPFDSSFESRAASEGRLPLGATNFMGTDRQADELRARDALLRLASELPGERDFAQLGRRWIDGLRDVFPGCELTLRLGSGSEFVEAHTEAPRSAREGTDALAKVRHEVTRRLADGCSSLCLRKRELPTDRDFALLSSAVPLLSAALERVRLQAHADKLNAHLVNAEKLASLGRIVAGVVHELNNPLTGILACTTLLTRRLAQPSPEGRQQDLERVQRIADAAERILSFTRDLVAYARPTPTPHKAVRVREVIDRAVLFCEHEFSNNGVAVERAYLDPLPEVLGVPDQLTQVFVNLFTNAVHAMTPGGGALAIRARKLDAHAIQVDVCDSGTGIPEDLLPQVFEPFFTTKPRGHGTGLGLSIVHDIITTHRGTIAVESKPAVGTTFRLTLPLAG